MILLLVTTSLWVWERYDSYIEDKIQTDEYNKLLEENKLLRYEVENLQKQNRLLNEVIGLKRKLK